MNISFLFIGNTTYSKRGLGILIHEECFAMTGKRAPIREPIRIMKTEAMRSPSRSSAPPPEPQCKSSPSLLLTCIGRSKGKQIGRELISG